MSVKHSVQGMPWDIDFVRAVESCEKKPLEAFSAPALQYQSNKHFVFIQNLMRLGS